MSVPQPGDGPSRPGDGLEARGASGTQVATGLPVRGRRWKRGELNPAFRIVASIVIPTFRFSSNYHWYGPNRLPADGAFVLAPNHFTNIDPLVVGTAVYISKRAPRFLAKASLFKVPVLGWFLRKTGQVPVERAGRTRGSDPLASARKIADDGLGVVIYPEGSLTRDPDLWPMRGKTGAVRTALQQNIPVIPAAHWGTQLVMPRYGKKISLFPRKTINIVFGDPVDLSAFRGKGLDSSTLTAATEVVMAAITELLETLRDAEAPAHRWDPSKNNQSETGRFDQP